MNSKISIQNLKFKIQNSKPLLRCFDDGGQNFAQFFTISVKLRCIARTSVEISRLNV